MTESVERVALEKMRDDLTKERADFTAQHEQFRAALAQTEMAIQRADGALVVVQKILADTVPQPEAAVVPDGAEQAVYAPGGVRWVPDRSAAA